MLEVIEKLLILQDRDRKILRVESEFQNVGPERTALERKASENQSALENAKLKGRQIETERKKLELEVDSKKQQIEKYSLQQFQTKKNDEYRALGNEINNCKAAISKLEDQQLELMEQADLAHKEVIAATQAANEVKKAVDAQISELATREQRLKKELAELQSNYEELTAAVEEGVLSRYMRLRKHKGANTVVGVEHSVCGGCHMKLPTQIVISCQGQQELVNCPNCGRILYYTPHMDLAFVD